MPSYEDLKQMESEEVYRKLVECKPEVVHRLVADLYQVLHTGSYPLDSFYTVKTTLTMLKGLLSASDLYGKHEN